jgi:hypothetical protein
LTIENNLEAGNEVDSRCLKCKDVTNHTIIAMVNGKVGKVQCNVCGARHNYRPVTTAKAGGTKRGTTARPAAGGIKLSKTEARFEALLAGREPSAALTYAMTGTFKQGDLLNHPTFGLGVVTGTVTPNKIEVQFRQETKMLICVLPPA